MPKSAVLTRRSFIAFSATMGAVQLSGCATSSGVPLTAPIPFDRPKPVRPVGPPSASELAAMYAATVDDGHAVGAAPYEKIDPKYYRQRVVDPTGEQPGTVVVDTPSRFLYVVEPGGTAMRYGVGIGRDGFAWQGDGVIQWRQKWPRWKPPNEMVARQPELKKYSIENGGMDGGIDNPLGARALYIFSGGQDTLYRLHGNKDWRSIGKAVSSGCVRLLNQDVIDLYTRVPFKARIVVRQ